MFSREEYYGLWGNKWFKNLTSLYLGTELMRRYGVTELPDKYRPLQQTVVEERSLAPVLVGSEGARREVMKSPDPFDFLEMQIHYYAMQNMQWSNIWRGRYREVEGHMAAYLARLEEDRAAAVEQHLAWLMDQKGQGVTPFQDEAEAFAKIVKDNKKRQGNELLKA